MFACVCVFVCMRDEREGEKDGCLQTPLNNHTTQTQLNNNTIRIIQTQLNNNTMHHQATTSPKVDLDCLFGKNLQKIFWFDQENGRAGGAEGGSGEEG